MGFIIVLFPLIRSFNVRTKVRIKKDREAKIKLLHFQYGLIVDSASQYFYPSFELVLLVSVAEPILLSICGSPDAI